MADPTKYKPHFNYSGWEAAGSKRPKPGAELDTDFANIERSIDETIDALKDIRRSDGKLKNGIVGPDAFDDAARDLIAGTSAQDAAEEAREARDAAAEARDQATNAAQEATDTVADTAKKSQNLSDLTNLKEARSNLGTFATAADVENSHIPPVLESIRLNGYHEPGDGGGGLFVEGTSTDPGAIKSANDLWYKPADDPANIKAFGARGDGGDDTEFIQAAINSGAKTIYRPAGVYLVSSLTYDDDVTFTGPGKIIPSSEWQTRQYGGVMRVGVKDRRTYPLNRHGGMIIGGEGPTPHGPMLKSQRINSLDIIPSRESNPVELQLYAHACDGVVATDGVTNTVTFVKGFAGDFRHIYEGDTLWIGPTSYVVTAKNSETELEVSSVPPQYESGISAFILYENHDCVVDIDGTDVALVAGEGFFAGESDHNLIIDGTRYSFTPTSYAAGILDTDLGQLRNQTAVFRCAPNEHYVTLFRLQRLRGQGTEETLSLSARPYEYLLRIGRTADGIGRYSPFRIQGWPYADAAFPNNRDEQTLLAFDTTGHVGWGIETPEAAQHVRRRISGTQGDYDSDPVEMTFQRWDAQFQTAGTRRCLDVVVRNDHGAPYLQARSGGSGQSTAPLALNKEGGAVEFGEGIEPLADTVGTNGRSNRRWDVVYAVTGSINTSDAREKTPIRPLTEAERNVAIRLSRLPGVYQWLSAIAQKGEDEARLHVGVTAQDVKAAFDAEGLDGFRYGVLCYDEWGPEAAVTDDDGSLLSPAVEAGDRYGVRYDELAQWQAAGWNARLEALENSGD